jgi:hypothetical protein
MMDAWPGLLIGLLGSLHCVGMCGPLALALPSASRGRREYVAGRILYNVGRVVTYVLLGALFGLVGRTFALAGWQQALSIVAGLVMLAAALSAHLIAPTFHLHTYRVVMTRLVAKRTNTALFGIGLLNGWLPCGLVYVALAGAAATGSVARGGMFMAAFGFGTLPAMVAVSLMGRAISAPVRLKFQRAVPIVLSVVAVLLILRGLNLGIPFVSPVLADQVNCCH